MMNTSSKDVSKVGWLSVVLNTLLFGLKFWAGTLSGSVAIIADAWHTLSDSATSLIVLIGAKISSRPADKEHPFGHGRADLIGSVIIGILLAIVAFQMFIDAFEKLLDHQQAHYNWIAISVIAFSIVAKEVLAQISFRVARRTGNASLKADGWHHRSDSISSVIILAGMLFAKNFWWIDGVLGIAVALLLCFATYQILKDSIGPLLGEIPDNAFIGKIVEICESEAGSAVSPHHFHKHVYGSHTEVTFHIYLRADLSLYEAHKITDVIEKRIREELQLMPTIHFEPADSKTSIS